VKKLVSIIIVNYNSFDLLDTCLNSINTHLDANQYEVILVDNNSEGDISQITGKYENIQLIKNNKNIGFAAANNRAIELVDTKYTLLINNDIFFTENSLKKIIEIVDKKEEEVIVGVRLLNPDGSIQESAYQFPSLWNTFTESFFLSYKFRKNKVFSKSYLSFSETTLIQSTDSVKGAFMLCSTHLLKRIGGFDERFFFYSEDIDLCKRFSEKGGKVYFFPSTSVIHYETANVKKDFWFYFKNLSMGKNQYYQKQYKSGIFLVLILIHSGILLRIPIYLLVGLIKMRSDWIKKSMIYLRLLIVYPQNQFCE